MALEIKSSRGKIKSNEFFIYLLNNLFYYKYHRFIFYLAILW